MDNQESNARGHLIVEEKQEGEKHGNKQQVAELSLKELLKKIDTIDPFAEFWQPDNRINAKIWLLNNFNQDDSITAETLKAKQEEQKEKLSNSEMIARLIDIVEQSQSDEGDEDSSFDMDGRSSSLSSSHGDADREGIDDQDQGKVKAKEEEQAEKQRMVDQGQQDGKKG